MFYSPFPVFRPQAIATDATASPTRRATTPEHNHYCFRLRLHLDRSAAKMKRSPAVVDNRDKSPPRAP